MHTAAHLCADGDTTPLPHQRRIGWAGTAALALGGSNQSLFLLSALVVGQGSAAVPLLIAGFLLSAAAAFGWTELILMWPDRVGGIAATCAEAFRPYSPVLASLTGVCYWWGWVPTCGLTALLAATAINGWYLPQVPIPALATALVVFFTAVNLCGIRWAARLAIPMATVSATLAFLSGAIPLITGQVDWHQATTFHLLAPFGGEFGQFTGAMAGLYMVGVAAPAFEAATCYVGETVDPTRNVPRALMASGAMGALFCIVLPLVWLGALGPGPLQGNLQVTLSPTFSPLLGDAAQAVAIWFLMLSMFHGTLQPLAGASRTLLQLADDGLVPRVLGRRSRTGAPWVAILLTAGLASAFLVTGDPTWVIAAATLPYLIGIGLPSVAVWLLRRNAPRQARPYRAPRGTLVLGLVAAMVWALSAILGIEQFGLPTVLLGIALSCSGAALYTLRRWSDRRPGDKWSMLRSLHVKLSGAMLLVLTLNGAGYLLAVSSIPTRQAALIAALQDIFMGVALVTVSVGLVLPGMISFAVGEVARAADDLATGTLADFSRAMQALGAGDLDAAHARVAIVPVVARTRDEVGAMAVSFTIMQKQIAAAAVALDGAREGLQRARAALRASNAELTQAAAELERRVEERTMAVQKARAEAVAQASRLEAIFEAIADGLLVSSRGGQVLEANRAAALLLQGDGAEALTMNDDGWQLVLRDEQDQPLAPEALPLARILGGEMLTGSRVVDVMVHAGGSRRYINLSGAPVRDSAGLIAGGVVVLRDVTERRLLEQRTQEALKALITMATTLVLMPAGATGQQQPGAARALAARLADLARSVLGCARVAMAIVEPDGASLQTVTSPDEAPQEVVWWVPAAFPEGATGPFTMPDGRALPADASTVLAPATDGRGAGTAEMDVLITPMRVGERMIGFLGTTHQDPRHAYRSDEIALATAVGTLVALMLEHDRALRERAEARASVLALHEANRRMDEFLSLASHELRTPMTVAKGNLQLTVLHVQKALREGALLGHDPQSVTTLLQMLERADHHMGRLSRLVDDLVDVSRILADKLELRVTFCDLGNLVSEVVQGQRLIAAPRPIHLTLPAGTPVRILADAGRIEQVLTNYLTNALKYSPATSPIHVGLSVDDTSARVWVRDEGPGLAPEEQDRIWGRFYQVAGVTSYISAHVGLGLGLHISRTIIEQHHGQVGVESTRGHGATFWFTLPLYTAKAA